MEFVNIQRSVNGMVRFQVSMVTRTKMAVFWNVARDDGDSKILWSVGQYLPEKAKHLRTQPPEIRWQPQGPLLTSPLGNMGF
jgi:hypothetical protein